MLTLILVLLVLPLCRAAEPNTLSKAEQDAGWKLLFDGKMTEGWLEVTGKPFPSTWTVEDGCLKAIATGTGFQDLRTIDVYRSFEFAFDWKIEPKGNSGVKYLLQRVDEWNNKTGRQSRARGFEYQLADDANEEASDATRSAGSLYSAIAPSQRVHPAISTFNQSRIIVKGQHVEHWLNGTKVVEYETNAPVVTALIRRMNKSGEAVNIPAESPICLQNHDSPVWFCNLKVRRLD